MSLQLAKEPYSVKFKTWLLNRLFPVEFVPEHRSSLKKDFLNAFKETYEPDGEDISDGSYVLAPGFVEYGDLYKSKKHWFLSRLAVFLGLPSRATTLNNKQDLVMELKQFGLNLIGGWDFDPKISREKKIFQWISLPFKILIIAPLKVITFPFKLLINIVKLFTEFLPLVLSSITARLFGALVDMPALGLLKDFPTWQNVKSTYGFVVLLYPLVLCTVKLPHLLFGILHFSFRLIALAGRAITSPEKNIRMALTYGRELKITLFGKTPAGEAAGRFLSNVIGLLGALISVSLTATLWIITLPLALGAISTYIPALVQAITWFSQLPAVVATMTWFAQFPVITASLGAVHGALGTLGLVLSSAFGPAIGALASAIGVNISVGVMVTSTALALIAAPLTSIITRIGDELSNLWASWTNAGLVTKFIRFVSRPDQPATGDAKPLLDDKGIEMRATSEPVETDKEEKKLSPSTDAKSLTLTQDSSYEEVIIADDHVSNTEKKPTEYFRPAQQDKLFPQKDFAKQWQKHIDSSNRQARL